MPNPQTKTISLPIADIWINDDHVIWISFKKTDSHDLNDAKQVVDAHNSLANGQPCAIIADLRNIKVGADRNARTYYVSEESSRLKLAMAMVTNSSIQRMAGNVFLKLNRPPYPARIFTDTTSALKWLGIFEEK